MTDLTTKSLYEVVENLPAGTIFQVRDGSPWLRSSEGVEDLMCFWLLPRAYAALRTKDMMGAIPNDWRVYRADDWEINVLYVETEED